MLRKKSFIFVVLILIGIACIYVGLCIDNKNSNIWLPVGFSAVISTLISILPLLYKEEEYKRAKENMEKRDTLKYKEDDIKKKDAEIVMFLETSS